MNGISAERSPGARSRRPRTHAPDGRRSAAGGRARMRLPVRTPVLLTTPWTTPALLWTTRPASVHERPRTVDQHRPVVDSTSTTCCDRITRSTTTSCGFSLDCPSTGAYSSRVARSRSSPSEPRNPSTRIRSHRPAEVPKPTTRRPAPQLPPRPAPGRLQGTVEPSGELRRCTERGGEARWPERLARWSR